MEQTGHSGLGLEGKLMQYIAGFFIALGDFIKKLTPHQHLMWVGSLILVLSGISGFAGVAVVDEMRMLLAYVGCAMMGVGSVMVAIHWYIEAKLPPRCDHDPDSE